MAAAKRPKRPRKKPRESLANTKIEISDAAMEVRPSRSGQHVVRVNTDSLEAPKQAMAATTTMVAEDAAAGLVLIFGQRLPCVKRLAHALAVSISNRDFWRSLTETNPDFVSHCLRFVRDDLGYEPRVIEYDADIVPPERVVYKRASVVSLTFSGEEADIRFWQMQPHVLRKTSPKEVESALAPVVIVYLPTVRLADMLLTIQSVVEGHES